MSDLISRQAAIDALTALEEPAPTGRHLFAIGKQVCRVVDNMHRELDVLFPISYPNYNR